MVQYEGDLHGYRHVLEEMGEVNYEINAQVVCDECSSHWFENGLNWWSRNCSFVTWLAGFGEEATVAVAAASGTLSHCQESRNGW